MLHKKGYTAFVLATTVTLALTFSDLFITFIVTPDLTWEANPLVSVLGFGWGALIGVNIKGNIIFACLFYFCFVKYERPDIHANNLREYMSIILYNRPDKFIWCFYKFPSNKEGWRALAATTGYLCVFMVNTGRVVFITNWLIIYTNSLHPWIDGGLRSHWFHYTLGTIPALALAAIPCVIIGVITIFLWFNAGYKMNKKRRAESS
ncbi:MAG: hypothetical protein FWC16_06670 [Defluviitaleaceae bacterium]|nr:hypothetical protein [Defluviitaleaceae bacterium]MCL2274594.1 hypothetical protein [Defluviitaleaceae bacterium]